MKTEWRNNYAYLVYKKNRRRECKTNMNHWKIIRSMLVHHLRRWPNIDPTIGERHMLAGNVQG